MTLRAIESQSLADQVFGQLLAEIVGGSYPPDTAIPSERALTGIFGVNRHVVREALKRLEQVGLVRIAQGGSTKVLDFRRTAGLDLLALIAERAEAIEGLRASAGGLMPLLLAALEMRLGIGVDVARLCAARADDATRDELTAIAEQLAAADGIPAVVALDRRFWQVMLDGAGNLAYQLAFNSLIRGVDVVPDLSTGWLEHELRRGEHRRPIARAIADRDPEAAAEATRAALTPDPALAAALQTTTPATQERARR